MKGKGMKSRNRKNELLSALRSSVRPVGALFFIALLAIGLFGKQTTHAASDRAKKVAAKFALTTRARRRHDETQALYTYGVDMASDAKTPIQLELGKS